VPYRAPWIPTLVFEKAVFHRPIGLGGLCGAQPHSFRFTQPWHGTFWELVACAEEIDRQEATAGDHTTLLAPKRIASDTAEISNAPNAFASSTFLSPLAALGDDEDIWTLLFRTRESLL
jgi:hypothetical protein